MKGIVDFLWVQFLAFLGNLVGRFSAKLQRLAAWLSLPMNRRVMEHYKPAVPAPPEPLKCRRCRNPGAFVELETVRRDEQGAAVGFLVNPWVPPEGWERVRVGSFRNYPCDDDEAVIGVLCPRCAVDVRGAVLAVLGP